MIILVSGATATVGRYGDLVGRLVSPRARNRPATMAASGQRWAADNGAFAGFDPAAFDRMIGRIAEADRARLLWVACPDAVGDARGTLALWRRWAPELHRRSLPAALVLQDGLESIAGRIPWPELAAVFVGGSTAWKLSRHAERIAGEAKARGLWVHMGRVNTRGRVMRAAEMGCDSFDGLSFSAWPDAKIPRGLAWIREARAITPPPS